MPLSPEHFISVVDRFIDDVTRSRLVWREWLKECRLGFWRYRQLARYETSLCLVAYGVIYEEVYRNWWMREDAAIVRNHIVRLETVRQNKEIFAHVIQTLNRQPNDEVSLKEEIYTSIIMQPYIERFGRNGHFGSKTELVAIARISRNLCNRYWADLGIELAPLWTSPTEDQIARVRRESVHIEEQFWRDMSSAS